MSEPIFKNDQRNTKFLKIALNTKSNFKLKLEINSKIKESCYFSLDITSEVINKETSAIFCLHTSIIRDSFFN